MARMGKDCVSELGNPLEVYLPILDEGSEIYVQCQ